MRLKAFAVHFAIARNRLLACLHARSKSSVCQDREKTLNSSLLLPHLDASSLLSLASLTINTCSNMLMHVVFYNAHAQYW